MGVVYMFIGLLRDTVESAIVNHPSRETTNARVLSEKPLIYLD
jgi:hypothetical protein